MAVTWHALTLKSKVKVIQLSDALLALVCVLIGRLHVCRISSFLWYQLVQVQLGTWDNCAPAGKIHFVSLD